MSELPDEKWIEEHWKYSDPFDGRVLEVDVENGYTGFNIDLYEWYIENRTVLFTYKIGTYKEFLMTVIDQTAPDMFHKHMEKLEEIAIDEETRETEESIRTCWGMTFGDPDVLPYDDSMDE